MEIRPIKTEKDYNSALSRIDKFWGVKKDTPEGDEFDLLVTLVESYELKHYPIAPPDPIEAIKFRMEQMGLSQTNLAEILGSKHRASEYLNRKLPLSIQAIRKIKAALNIPGYILIQEYETVK